MSLLGKWIYGLPAWFMNAHSTSNRRAGDFIPSAMRDSELFWSKKHWFCWHDWFKPEELQQDHTRTLQSLQVRGIFCHQRHQVWSLGCWKIFTLTNISYYPPNQAAVPLYLKSLKSIDIKMLTYKLVLLVVPLGLSCWHIRRSNSGVYRYSSPGV